MTTETIELYDPAPWFDAATLAGTTHNLGVMAGRWIALLFVNDLSHAYINRILAEIIISLGKFFNDDHVIFYAVLTSLPLDATPFSRASHRGLGFMTDYDHAITKLYGCDENPRLIVLDPMLRVAHMSSLSDDAGCAANIISYLSALPRVDDFAGVPLSAPALIIPNIFEPAFCKQLIDIYEHQGGKDSGFMVDEGGKTRTILDHEKKQRFDCIITEPSVREMIRERVVRRMIPSIERFYQYRPTRMDRYLVSCYDAKVGGHFSRHRDNINAGARHRRFAASFNLNDDYDGCDLIFPEFGRRIYRAPVCGAIAFSTGALHQVTPITRGKRYAFVPFFYGEGEVTARLSNNQLLHDNEERYSGENDKLFPA